MKKPLLLSVLLSTFSLMAGCASEARLEQILADILPPDVQIEIDESCVKVLGPAVVRFSLEPLSSEESVLDRPVDGLWVRSESLGDFANADAQEHRGLGIGGTILDGKQCLRDISEEADEILFGAKSGLYFRSDNRQIVVILFDDPEGQGVMFIQAP